MSIHGVPINRLRKIESIKSVDHLPQKHSLLHVVAGFAHDFLDNGVARIGIFRNLKTSERREKLFLNKLDERWPCLPILRSRPRPPL